MTRDVSGVQATREFRALTSPRGLSAGKVILRIEFDPDLHLKPLLVAYYEVGVILENSGTGSVDEELTCKVVASCA